MGFIERGSDPLRMISEAVAEWITDASKGGLTVPLFSNLEDFSTDSFRGFDLRAFELEIGDPPFHYSDDVPPATLLDRFGQKFRSFAFRRVVVMCFAVVLTAAFTFVLFGIGLVAPGELEFTEFAQTAFIGISAVIAAGALRADQTAREAQIREERQKGRRDEAVAALILSGGFLALEGALRDIAMDTTFLLLGVRSADATGAEITLDSLCDEYLIAKPGGAFATMCAMVEQHSYHLREDARDVVLEALARYRATVAYYSRSTLQAYWQVAGLRDPQLSRYAGQTWNAMRSAGQYLDKVTADKAVNRGAVY